MRFQQRRAIICMDPNEWTRMTSKGFIALLIVLGAVWIVAVWTTFEYMQSDQSNAQHRLLGSKE